MNFCRTDTAVTTGNVTALLAVLAETSRHDEL